MISLKFTATSIFVLVSVMAMARADVIAWSGDHCDPGSGEGADVPCDGACAGFFGRHSIEVSGDRCDVRLQRA
jgi:hypothetical protein